MIDVKNLIREDLKSFVPYEATVPKVGKPNEKIIKLDANESSFGIPKELKNGLMEFLEDEDCLKFYPDSSNAKLREDIGKVYSVDKSNVTCGVGSDQIIDYITKVFIEKDELVLTINPTFSMYLIATNLNGGKVIELSLSEESGFEFNDELVEKVIKTANNSKVKMLFLCSPNNPTGDIITNERIKKIVENVNCVVVVDEAYGEFASESFVCEVLKYENVVLLKTFSKALGIAGARIGFAIGNKKIIDAINLVKAPYNLPTFTQKVASLVCENMSVYEQRIENVKKLRNNILAKYEKISLDKITIYKSEANFILIKTSEKLSDKLLEKNVIVKNVSWEMEGFLTRITIGTELENEIVFNFIQELLR